MPKPDASLSAVVVSGGKQYRVAPGDQILVDRLDAEPGSSLKLGRVLLFSHGDETRVGSPLVDGVEVEVKVLAHRRGPRVESLRYKSKKRVRVHHGGRADLTALHVIAVGGLTGKEQEKQEEQEAEQAKAKPKGRSKAKSKAKAAAVAEAEVESTAAATGEAAAPEAVAEVEPAKRAPRRARKPKESE